MMFNNVIVKLNYGEKNNLNKILPLLGLALTNKSDADDASLVFIKVVDDKIEVIKQKAAKGLINKINVSKDNNNETLYAITQQQYLALTSDQKDKQGKVQEAVLHPEITDKLGVRLSSTFASDMAKIVALFLTAALMPILNLFAVPIFYALGHLIINTFRYRTTFGRWPNSREFGVILGNAVHSFLEMNVSVMLYSIVTGVSFFAPLAIHSFSIGSVSIGGPLLTYLVAPLIIATVLAVGVTLYNDLKILFNHFFDMRFTYNRFPFISIKFKKERESLSELAKKLLYATVKEFSITFITTLSAVYLSYIPGAAIAGYVFKGAASTVVTAVVKLSIQIATGLFNTFVISTALDKLFDVAFNASPVVFWNKLFKSKNKKQQSPQQTATASAIDTPDATLQTVPAVSLDRENQSLLSSTNSSTSAVSSTENISADSEVDASDDDVLSMQNTRSGLQMGLHRKGFFNQEVRMKSDAGFVTPLPMSFTDEAKVDLPRDIPLVAAR